MNEPSNRLGSPYASAIEIATTVPGKAHGNSTSSDSNRRQTPRFIVVASVATQKLHSSAATAAIADIERLLRKTSLALLCVTMRV